MSLVTRIEDVLIRISAEVKGKAPLSHSHAITDVTNLQSTLDGKVGSSTITTIWTGTQASYDGIGTKSDTTLYVIID